MDAAVYGTLHSVKLPAFRRKPHLKKNQTKIKDLKNGLK